MRRQISKQGKKISKLNIPPTLYRTSCILHLNLVYCILYPCDHLSGDSWDKTRAELRSFWYASLWLPSVLIFMDLQGYEWRLTIARNGGFCSSRVTEKTNYHMHISFLFAEIKVCYFYIRINFPTFIFICVHFFPIFRKHFVPVSVVQVIKFKGADANSERKIWEIGLEFI